MTAQNSSIDAYVEQHFCVNEYGIWCPNCQEQIDASWPASCDYCGYPAADHETFDDPDYGEGGELR